MPPLIIVLGRVAIAAIAINILLLFTRYRMPVTCAAWLRFVPMGLLNNLIPFCLIVWGQTQITSGLASILNATTPIFTLFAAHFLTTDERMTQAKFMGTVAALIGVVILIGPSVLAGLGLEGIAQLGVVGAAVAYAFAGIYGRRFRDQSPLVTACGQLTTSSLMLLPIVVLTHLLSADPWVPALPSTGVWLAVLGLALISTALAYYIYFQLLASAGASNLLLVTFLVPVSAVLLGTLVLGEALGPRELLGMAFIGLGLIIIDGRVYRFLNPYAVAQT